MAEERAIARQVLEALPKDALLKGQVTIEVVSWDDPQASVPMLAGLTPQQAVDRGLPAPSDCDLTVVIVWGRIGTPLSEPRKADGSQYLSGTEYEFENATVAGKPVFVYRRTSRIPATLDDPDLEEKRRQKALVDGWFGRFANADGTLSGGYQPYEDLQGFREKFEAHAKAFIRERLASRAVGAQASGKPGRRRTDRSPVGVPAAYREWLQSRCASVELLGLRLKQGQAVRLNNVYVPLTTTRISEAEEPKRARRRNPSFDERDSDQLLLDRIGQDSAYISGDPGTGKSTFCRWLTWLACEGAVPEPEVETPDEYRERLAPSLAGRLPLLVPLRDFWPELSGTTRLWRRDIESTIARWLETRSAPGMSEDLVAEHIEQGTALLIFDGIDEVPPAPRLRLLDALAEAREAWIRQGNRVVITSRPYGLTDSEIRRLGLPHVPIRPIPQSLQELLVRRWFRILAATAEDGDASAVKMLGQVREQDWLSPLTQNPLLLTGMCIVFGDGKGLPEDKYELYDRVADVVLHNRIPNPQQRRLVRSRLAVVAHGMHTGEGLGETRDTPQAQATHNEIDRMLRVYQERSAWTEGHEQEISEARDELVTQTGLLLPRGERDAGFLHLSFQEFLAAQRVADVETDRLREIFIERSRLPEWRNTLSFLYGAVLYQATTPERGVRLLTDLVARLSPDNAGLTLAVADGAEILLRRSVRLAPEVNSTLKQACLDVMRGEAPARERALAGAALGRIGDPRFREDRWLLPDDDLLGFVEVPAGPFTMGSDPAEDKNAYGDEQPQHQVTLPAYYIARWPVTVAQFKAFVDDPDNGGLVPGDPDCVKAIANHPVVNISWHEALAYCAWLTGKLRSLQDLPGSLQGLVQGGPSPAWQVTLASEAEWEKAARGNDARIYPWGPTPDPERANYDDTGIGGPSAVGCFPRGRSPFDVEELSGNVWEWTRSLWVDRHPYVPGVEREGLTKDGLRVVGGGAFLNSSRSVRAACRDSDVPDYRCYFVGFRVVVSPFSSDL